MLRMMANENPTRDAAGIDGELLMLGLDVPERTASGVTGIKLVLEVVGAKASVRQADTISHLPQKLSDCRYAGIRFCMAARSGDRP